MPSLKLLEVLRYFYAGLLSFLVIHSECLPILSGLNQFEIAVITLVTGVVVFNIYYWLPYRYPICILKDIFNKRNPRNYLRDNFECIEDKKISMETLYLHIRGQLMQVNKISLYRDYASAIHMTYMTSLYPLYLSIKYPGECIVDFKMFLFFILVFSLAWWMDKYHEL